MLPEDGSATSRTIQVPNEMVGKIIGKGGATIRQLQDLSGAHADVAKQTVLGEQHCRATLTGGPEQAENPRGREVQRPHRDEARGAAAPGRARHAVGHG